jgi:hypothetical protein
LRVNLNLGEEGTPALATTGEEAVRKWRGSVKSFFQQIIKVLYELSKCPLTPDENKKLDQALRDFEKVFSPDPSDWIKKVFEVYEENGMNPLDEKSIEDKLKDDPYKALELSAKVMGSIFHRCSTRAFREVYSAPSTCNTK